MLTDAKCSLRSTRAVPFLRAAAATLTSFALLVCAAGRAAAQRVWVEQGPGPNTAGQVENITDREVAGAVHALAAHPTDANTLYVGAVNGGIWKTTNATAASPTWVPQLGLNQALSVGAIAFDPTDATNQTLMAGAGRFSSFAGRGADRVGVWRTTNGGTSWTLMTTNVAGLNISGVAPRGATLVVTANAADTFANRGVWRSTNTGASFTQISGGAGTGLPAGASFDLAADPSNNARFFTNAGTAGIFRSDDTGATWTKVSDAAVDAVMAGAGNVEIAVGTSNNVYVAIVSASRLAGLFRSPDGGATWAALDVPTTTEAGSPVGIHPGAQGNTHLSLAADRTNANVVYVGGDRQPTPFPNSIGASDFSGRLFRVDASQPLGSQAAHITHTNTAAGSSPHADSRDMAMDASNNLIEANDGGVYRRTTPLTNAGDWFAAIGNLKVTELHNSAWDSRSKIIIGGAQDTGTPQQVTPGNARWASVSTADGGDVAVDDSTTPGTSVRYSSNQNLGAFRRRIFDTSNTFVSQVFPALTVVGGGAALARQFTTPIALNRVTPTRLIIGGANSVYESLDQGDTITEIGPGIVANAGGTDPLAYGANGNAEMLYVGSGDDVFVRTAAAPSALTASATYPGNGTGRPVVAVVIHPTETQTAFVADATNVYRTPDAGATWTNVTGDLLTLTPGDIKSITFSASNATGSVVVGSTNGVFSAPGPGFNTWAAVGTGLPRTPVFDLEYDAVDEILVAGLLGRGVWSVNLDERDPVDVLMTLDLSGSMNSPACPTCEPKLQVLKDSVELFVQLWTVVAIPDDRLGVNYFDTNISEFNAPTVLLPVLPNAAAIIGDMQSKTAGNLTAMGGGLQQAVNRLTDATRPRNILVFTDGMQNVNPMVNTSTFIIENQAGRPNSNISPAGTDLNAALGIKVNTIGVGATPAFEALLSDIASETNGLSKLTTAPDEDLRRFYVEELIDVLRQASPQLIAYRRGTAPGGGATESFTTNSSARRVIFKLSWKRGTTMQFSVLKDGVDVTRLGRIVSGPFYRIFSIDVPRAGAPPVTPGGNWQLQIRGPDNTPYEVAAIVDEEELKYEFTASGTGRAAGDPLPLGVRLTFGGRPVTDARVTAQVLAPKQALGTLLSRTPTPAIPPSFRYEAGASDAQRKYQLLLGQDSFRTALRPSSNQITFRNNNDGSYSAAFPGTSVSGPYTVVFRVEGQRADIGSYDRTEIRSVNLTFATPRLSASDLRVITGDRAGGPFELSVRPVDNLGNFLGPDYGHAIVVTVDGVRVNAEPRDLLDGSYVFPLATTRPPALTNVNVTVLGRPLYNGLLSGIPGVGGGVTPKFAFSFHAGAAVPVNGFGPAAKTGLLTEFDFEYRVTPSFSLEGVLGRYDFGTRDEIYSGSLLFKGYVPAGSGGGRFYGSFGPGVFKLPGPNARFGLTGAGGFNIPFTRRLEADFGASYSHVFNSGGLGFLGLKGGVKFTF